MTDDQIVTGVPAVSSPRQRAQAVAKALSTAARRARFSTKHRRTLRASGLRARRGEKILRILKIVTFFAIAVAPSLAAIAYYGFIASKEYVSEARFTVRGGMPPRLDALGALTGAPTMLIIQDTQIIINYLRSRTLIEHLEKSIDLRGLYDDPKIDKLSRLSPDSKIEKFVRYWTKMTEINVQMPAGIVVFSVRAFDPDAAARIVDAALEESEVLVNKMNDQMIHDTLALAETERQRAESNLAATRAALERARNEEGTLSADRSADALNGLITSVRGELVKMQQDYETQRRYVSESAPQIRNLQTRIQSANDEIVKLQSHLTQGPDGQATKTLSGTMSRLDSLTLENTIAEKMYATTLALLEHARLASETKLMYINTFVRPVAAQEARYPHRALSIALSIAGAFAAWGAVVVLMTFIKNKLV